MSKATISKLIPSKAIIYTRVSTGVQAEQGTSLASQLEACQRKADLLELAVFALYEDAGMSGSLLTARPGMMQAIADITAGRADTLICADIDRYSRDVQHQWAIKKEIEAAGGRVVFCNMDFDDSPEGELNFGIQGTFKQYERKVIRARTMRGRRTRAEQGVQPVRTTSPLGYHIVTKADVLRGDYPAEQLGRYLVIESQATLVRDLFAWYVAEGLSLAGIAKRLNLGSVPPIGRGTIWHCTVVRNILINPVYKGQAVFGRHERRMEEGRFGQPHPQSARPIRTNYRQKDAPLENRITIDCPPLIGEEQWDRAQRKLSENRFAKSGNPQRARMLAGRVFCPGCGGTMIFIPEKVNRKARTIPAHYTCSEHNRRQRLLGQSHCDAKTYRVVEAEAAVVAALLDAIQNPGVIASAMEAYREGRRPGQTEEEAEHELAAIEEDLRGVEAEQAATVQAQIAGILAGAAPGAYNGAFAAIAKRRKGLEVRREKLKATRGQKAGAPATAESILRDVQTALCSPDVTDAEKRHLVGLVIEKVICRKKGGVVVFHPGVFGASEMENAETVHTIKTVSVGDLSSSIVHPREVFKDAVVASAASVIVAHNHPSGDPTPSAEDVAVTKRLMGAGEILGIDLLDHIVVGDGVFVSLKEKGLI